MVELIEKELSYQLTGVCYKVHNRLGRFLTEKQYCDALVVELEKEGIAFTREELIVANPENYSLKIGRPDFIVEKRIVLDAKAKKFITKADYEQMLKYLYLTNIRLGLIVNFHSSYLKAKRVVNNKIH